MKTERGFSVLCLLIFTAIVFVVASIFIVQLVNLIKRTDSGQVPIQTNRIDDIFLPGTNGLECWAVALHWEWKRVEFPDTAADSPPEVPPFRAPVVGVWLDGADVRLSIYRPEESLPVNRFMALDASGIPIDWKPLSSLQPPGSIPVELERSEDLTNWSSAATLYLTSTNEVLFQDSTAAQRRFYRARR